MRVGLVQIAIEFQNSSKDNASSLLNTKIPMFVLSFCYCVYQFLFFYYKNEKLTIQKIQKINTKKTKEEDNCFCV